MQTSESQLLAEQKRYYQARAPEYDAWWERRGRYDRGTAANARWFAEAAALKRELARFEPRGEVLELACGTGIWTSLLARYADHVTAVDAAAEMLALNRRRLGDRVAARGLGGARVDYVRADLFDWCPPPASYDVCFFAFWLSHIPESRFAWFWRLVVTALRPGGRIFFIDSDRSEVSTATDHQLPAPDEETMARRLDDGREFRIVKRFFDPADLERQLAGLGVHAQIRRTGEFFVYGTGRLSDKVRHNSPSSASFPLAPG